MTDSQITLAEFGRLLRRRASTLLLVALVTLGVGIALAVTRPKRYQSQAKVVLTPVLGKNLTFIPAQESLQALINAYAETARSASALAAARQLLGRPLHGTATSFTQAGDDSVTLAATADSPQLAREDTAALLSTFEASMHGNTFFTVSVVSPPSLPTQSVQPRPPLIIGSAAVLGLVLGLLLALLVDYVRREPDHRGPDGRESDRREPDDREPIAREPASAVSEASAPR
jgi:capsular polysaccharide biosynthesis protein